MYRGRGDYIPGYGDPGIFGAIGHVLGGAALGFVTGGPLGAIRGAVGGTVAGVRKNIQEETLAAGGSGSAYTPALRAAHQAVVARAKAGGSTIPIGSSLAGTAHARSALRAGQQMRVSGGRRRRMNWANSKALGRAERRVKLAVKHFSRYFRWVHPEKGGHLAPAFRKKSRKH
jgi:hypothetical protein